MEKMNANEARKLSLRNKMNLEESLKQIEESTKVGSQSHMLFNPSEEAVSELMKLGYKVTIHKDPFNGIENYICYW